MHEYCFGFRVQSFELGACCMEELSLKQNLSVFHVALDLPIYTSNPKPGTR